jgi:hypothetical protein
MKAETFYSNGKNFNYREYLVLDGKTVICIAYQIWGKNLIVEKNKTHKIH